MLQAILKKHNIYSEDDLDVVMAKGGGPAFEELYEYFLMSGEMPYGIAKARTGDPHQWIWDKLQPLVAHGESIAS